MAGVSESPTRKLRRSELLERLGRAERVLKSHPALAEPLDPALTDAGEVDLSGLHTGDGETVIAEESVGDEETEWTADFPQEPDVTALDADSVDATQLSYHPATEEDLDRLWDWIRTDTDKGATFLGKAPANSSEMREQLAHFGEDLIAIVDAGVHIGFGGFSPQTAVYVSIHLYLKVEARGQHARLVPAFIAETQRRFPGQKLSVLTEDLAMARLYRRFGFTVRHLLTLESPAGETV